MGSCSILPTLKLDDTILFFSILLSTSKRESSEIYNLYFDALPLDFDVCLAIQYLKSALPTIGPSKNCNM